VTDFQINEEVFSMPFDMVRDSIEETFHRKMELLKEQMGLLDTLDDREKLGQYQRIIAEQDQLLKMSLFVNNKLSKSMNMSVNER
jgi:hypothetical protein